MGDGCQELNRERLQLHAEDIDVQHRRLFQLINALRNATEQDKNSSALSRAAETLIEYLEVHFSDEEEFMKQYDYPPELLQSHVSEHQRTLATLGNILKCIESGILRPGAELPNSFHQWLEDHNLTEDQAYLEYFRDEIIAREGERVLSIAEYAGN